MKKLPVFVKVLILALIIVNVFCIVLSYSFNYNLYFTPAPYFLMLMSLFVISGIASHTN